ncbi:nuclease domain-containing protein [Azospirillum thermophilum]|uniref:Uncharacterized protein n=1 Tax=Azospirillum thermophilum TaxID=2202148 RepID=A0A2S2CP44_9PROT|nr:hypothetical protein DEW08_08350 [Azospirillum thermophilum]
MEVTRPGAPPVLLLLDPKYKIDDANGTRPKKDDIDKMHAYRDSIVCGDGARGCPRGNPLSRPAGAVRRRRVGNPCGSRGVGATGRDDRATALRACLWRADTACCFV